MDGKDHLISPSSSDLHAFYAHQQQQRQRAALNTSPTSHLAGGGMPPHSVIRPMPNMSMTPTDILNSIGGPGSLAGMHHHQFHMDPSPPLLQHANIGASSASVSGTAAAPAEQPVKRKRGRPRKYGPDGTIKANAAAVPQQQQIVQPRTMGSLSGDMAAMEKKRRGRPPGTGKKHHLSPPPGNAFSGTAGTSFTPHIITASPSEDVAAKIVAFANQSSKAVCVLSATGSVSRAVLRHPADMSSRVASAPPYSNNNPDIYEGFYEILSLSGYYNLLTTSGELGLQPQQSGGGGGLNVTLCSPDRSVIGGVLGGALVAASTVQVVLGSFHQGGSRSKSKKAEKRQQAAAEEASPSSGHNNQNLTPPSVTTTTTTGGGGWPSSAIFDTTSSSIDINSSRG